MDDFSKNAISVVENYKDYLGNHQPWYAEDIHSGQLSDAQVDYYLNNPKFKNHVFQNHQTFRSLMWGYSRYQPEAMEIYIMINEILEDKARELPDKIRTTSVKTEKDANRFIGTYELDSDPDNTQFGKRLEVKLKDKDLYFTFEGEESPNKLLFFSAEYPVFGIYTTAILLKFESSGENTLSIITGSQSQTHWVKTSTQ